MSTQGSPAALTAIAIVAIVAAAVVVVAFLYSGSLPTPVFVVIALVGLLVAGGAIGAAVGGLKNRHG